MKRTTKKILIIRPGAIGDVAQTTIIPKSIKAAHPDYIIHYFTQCEIKPLLDGNPYIDKVIPFDRKKRKEIGYIFSIIKQLFNERYDIIFNLTNSFRNMLISFFSFPNRIVSRKYSDGLWVEDFFLTAKSVIPDIEISNRLFLSKNNEQDFEIKQILDKYPKPHIVFIPAGNTDKNRQGRIWNIKYWKELSKMVLNKYGGTVFICGSKSERKFHDELSTDNVIVLSGNYDLAGSSTLLSYADLVVSGDTGPIHIASAHNVKTLALLGSTSPDKIKPYGENGYFISTDTDCKYCWQKKCKYLKPNEKYTPCMENLYPEAVLKKIDEIFNK